MAFYFNEPSHTFGEYLLVPGYSSAECIPANVSLKTPLVKFKKGQEECPLSLNIPLVSAIMQSVSDDKMAIALAKEGGISFIYGSQSIEDEAAMVGYLYLFISALMKETSETRPRNASSSNQYVLNAIKYIQFNYSHDISIDDVAKSVGVSRSHLYRVFMLNVGKSPIDYLTEYRINEACKLLRAGNLSIAEVAISVGFFDQFYFSRVFKRAKGMPPSKYIAAQSENTDAPASEEA